MSTATVPKPTANGNGAVSHPEFPVDSFKEAAQHLRRPFTPAAVKFKPQTILGDGKGVLVVAYIDARLVVERLNLVCPHLWHDAYEPTASGLMWCHLTVDGITRSDVGEGKGKALVSDALKRAAVHFGVGVSLYAIPQQKIWVEQGDKFISVWRSGQHPNGKAKYDARIEPSGTTHLRDVYAHWLDRIGREQFGGPLDHGDVDDSQGDAEAVQPPPPAGVDRSTGEISESTATIDAAEAERIVQIIKGLGVNQAQVRMWLVEAGVEEIPSRGPVAPLIGQLTDPQAARLRERISAYTEPSQ